MGSGALALRRRASRAQVKRDPLAAGFTLVFEETLHHHGTTLVRRLRLAPGEATPWHRDPFHRVSVVLSGDALAIEYRDRSPTDHVSITPGQVDWEQPQARIHRAANVGTTSYEEVTIFFLDRPGTAPQPTDD